MKTTALMMSALLAGVTLALPAPTNGGSNDLQTRDTNLDASLHHKHFARDIGLPDKRVISSFLL